MTDQHAKLSPSGSMRRIKCPGSLLKEQGKKDEPNQYSEQGSSAHALAEKALKAGLFVVPDELLGKDWRDPKDISIGFPADDDMAEAVEVYLGEVADILANAFLSPSSPNVLIEGKLAMPGVHPNLAWGTVDFACYDEASETVFVRDYKHGRGIVDVDLENDEDGIQWNTQLLEYGYGAVVYFRDKGFEVRFVDIGVVQPNASHRMGPIRSAVLSTEDLMDFIHGVDKPSAKEALEPGGRLKAGKWCNWCKAKKECEEYTGHALSTIQEGFGPSDITGVSSVVIKLPSLKDMSDGQINNVACLFEILERYEKMVKSELLERAEKGSEFTDFVLTKTSPHRKWKEEAEAVLSISYGDEDIYDRKLKSPAGMEKALGRKAKADIESLVFKPEGVAAIAARKTTRFIIEPDSESEKGFLATTKQEEI